MTNGAVSQPATVEVSGLRPAISQQHVKSAPAWLGGRAHQTCHAADESLFRLLQQRNNDTESFGTRIILNLPASGFT